MSELQTLIAETIQDMKELTALLQELSEFDHE